MAGRPSRDRRWASCSSAVATWSSARPSTPTPSPTTSRWRARSLYSRPYYGTGYVLVRRKDGPRVGSLAELKGERSRSAWAPRPARSPITGSASGATSAASTATSSPSLKALSDGDIDFAYLWANVGWTLHASPDLAAKLELVPGFEPEDRWNIAVAMRRGDDELKRQVDAALGALIARRHRRPRPGPLPRAARPPPAADPRPRDAEGRSGTRWPTAAASRRCGRSRRPSILMPRWPGSDRPASWWWASIRTTCRSRRPIPRPAGLDYEIAGLLAEQLGVSLRVYWAFSAHDSYPSKLATKQLCDVILGVMPDDRFAQRVLYSRPYYVARYRLVVRSGDGRPAAPDAAGRRGGCRGARAGGAAGPSLSQHRGGPGGGGDGPRAGGLRDRDPRRPGWPTSAGRASSSSSPPPDSAPTRFPIVAAVRKSDRELKDAIDRAWDELERSGRLARVFARWHIPYESGGGRWR